MISYIVLLVLVTDEKKLFQVEKVTDIDLNLTTYKDSHLRYFMYQRNRYVWINDQASFVNVQALNERVTMGFLLENISGINKRQQQEL